MNGEEKIRTYLNRAFSGAVQSEKLLEAKEALCADLLEKYNSLLSRGHTSEAAYQATISGIGDIFELVDNVADEPQKSYGANVLSPASEVSVQFQKLIPFIVIGILLFIAAEKWLLPPMPMMKKFLPVLLFGVIIGGIVSGSILKLADKTYRKQAIKENIVTYVIWGVAALLFLWAMFTPHMGRILWIIPIAALVVHYVKGVIILQ